MMRDTVRTRRGLEFALCVKLVVVNEGILVVSKQVKVRWVAVAQHARYKHSAA